MKFLKSGKFVIPFAFVAAAILVNCTHSAEDVLGDLSVPAPQHGADVVKQQNLSGEYSSDCISYPLGGMRIISLSVSKENVSINTTYYDGTDCSAQDRTETLKGYLEESSRTGDVHLVKYDIPLGPHTSTWRYYNMRFAPSLITISDFGTEPSDLTGVEPMIALKQQSPPPAQPPVSGSAPSGTVLQSGDYDVVSGPDKSCGQNVGTMTSGNQVLQIFVSFLPPCSGFITMNCSGVVCTGSNNRVTFESATSYRYENLTENWSAELRKH